MFLRLPSFVRVAMLNILWRKQKPDGVDFRNEKHELLQPDETVWLLVVLRGRAIQPFANFHSAIAGRSFDEKRESSNLAKRS